MRFSFWFSYFSSRQRLCRIYSIQFRFTGNLSLRLLVNSLRLMNLFEWILHIKILRFFPSDQFWRSDAKSLQIKLKKYSDYQKFFIQVLRLLRFFSEDEFIYKGNNLSWKQNLSKFYSDVGQNFFTGKVNFIANSRTKMFVF